LQKIEENSITSNHQAADMNSNQIQSSEMASMASNPMGPQFASAIAKLYQVKSAYDQVIHNMGRQLNQMQQL